MPTGRPVSAASQVTAPVSASASQNTPVTTAEAQIIPGVTLAACAIAAVPMAFIGWTESGVRNSTPVATATSPKPSRTPAGRGPRG